MLWTTRRGSLRTFFSGLTFPPQTTRGTGADAILIDEAAYIDPNLFYKVIVPILSMKNTALVALSSPEGGGNYFSTLLELTKPDGSLFFQVVDCFRICTACLKLERVKAIECKHIADTPHWLSGPKIAELKTLYKSNPEDALREFGGISVSNHKPALNKDDVNRLFAGATFVPQSAPTLIFTTCDPNGGGPSQMSLASAYFMPDGRLVVSGHVFLLGNVHKFAHRLGHVELRDGMPREQPVRHNLKLAQKGVQVSARLLLGAPKIAGLVAPSHKGLNGRIVAEHL